ncbi:MAG: hypoxanthine phosphoribosyltransferase [candidate division Zixibacteria bacterium]|nr:hypoxanthine phosphoribosyltransferase [candidate division Zixibacteria bacterium]
MKDQLKIIIGKRALKEKIKELAHKISNDYRYKNPVLVGILKGSFIFMADLTRELQIPHQIDFISVASYGSGKHASGVVRWLKDLSINIEGKHVIIVEDIIDSGLTLNYIRNNLLTRKPKSLTIVTLLNKKRRRKIKIPLRYEGFSIPDEFVVGYGLDYGEKYRNLPYIAQLRNEKNE